MSIEEKLTTVAENMPKVYEAGQLSVFEKSVALQGYASGEIVCLRDIAPIEHEVSVALTSTDEYFTDYSNVNVIVLGKNWLKINDREVVNLGESSASVAREFTGNKVFLGMTANNIIRAERITNYSLGDTVIFTSTDSAYGLGFDVKVKPSTKYTISYSGSGSIRVGFFDKDGKYLTYDSLSYGYLTTTADTAWAVIVFRASAANVETTFANNQLELGTANTGYEEYIEPITAKADTTNMVKGIKSIYPSMTLMSDTDSVVLDCMYYKDIDKVLNNLAMNVAISGGE